MIQRHTIFKAIRTSLKSYDKLSRGEKSIYQIPQFHNKLRELQNPVYRANLMILVRLGFRANPLILLAIGDLLKTQTRHQKGAFAPKWSLAAASNEYKRLLFRHYTFVFNAIFL